jgi:hypothetical protein
MGAVRSHSSNVAARAGLNRVSSLGFSSSIHFHVYGKAHRGHLLSRSIVGAVSDKKEGVVPFVLADIGEGITGWFLSVAEQQKIE